MVCVYLDRESYQYSEKQPFVYTVFPMVMNDSHVEARTELKNISKMIIYLPEIFLKYIYSSEGVPVLFCRALYIK